MEKVSFPQNSGLKRYTEATKKFVKGDPIDVLSGHIVEQRVDFTLGQTIPLSFIRTWARAKDEKQRHGLCGKYWVDNFSEYAEISDNGQHIKIATLEGVYLRFALPIGHLHSENPDHPQFTLNRHRNFLELYNRETQTSKIFEIPTALFIEHNDDLGYPPLIDGIFPLSSWEDLFGNKISFIYNAKQQLCKMTHDAARL
ncbi:DUF6531 domain-containing protein [Pasteurella sp. PK-2025]|uniref:DUF6531 domain-containing protein n=1 Tax=Pasteurella sp. PK-2025 TaxID=3413133 RepID=UPI003C7753BC